MCGNIDPGTLTEGDYVKIWPPDEERLLKVIHANAHGAIFRPLSWVEWVYYKLFLENK